MSSGRPITLVELVGLAGSGKSTLRAAVERHVRCLVSDIDAADTRQNGFRPPLAHSCLTWARLVASQALSLRSLSVWLDVVRTLRRLQSCQSRGGIHVMDEGLLHKFRSVRRLSSAMISLDAAVNRYGYERLIPVSADLVVCITVSPEIYAERLMKRDGKQVDSHKARRAVDNMKFTLADIDCCKKHNPHMEALGVDNDTVQALENNALLIAEKAVALYRAKLSY